MEYEVDIDSYFGPFIINDMPKFPLKEEEFGTHMMRLQRWTFNFKIGEPFFLEEGREYDFVKEELVLTSQNYHYAINEGKEYRLRRLSLDQYLEKGSSRSNLMAT